MFLTYLWSHVYRPTRCVATCLQASLARADERVCNDASSLDQDQYYSVIALLCHSNSYYNYSATEAAEVLYAYICAKNENEISFK